MKGTGSGFTADPNLWGANGNVLDIARSGSTLYIAGSFRSVGENTGGFVPVDANSGELIRPFPKVAGAVGAIVPDGSGGWYLGGEFTAVGGKPRSCLAHILADGSVSDWNPSVTGSPGYIDPPAVIAIAIHDDRLYVGGAFREIGGAPHENLGCIDLRTGSVLSEDLNTDEVGSVRALTIHDGVLFVGGGFSTIAGQPRSSLAALDAATGQVMTWRADIAGNVNALVAHDGTLYVAGDFVGVNAQARPMLVALSTATAQLLPFDARVAGIRIDYLADPEISAMAMTGDTLYVAGDFTQIGGRSQSSVAALDAISGDALPWTPADLGPQYEGFPPPLCGMLAVSGETVYLGGWFETVGGESHPFVAALNKQTGAANTWNPRPDLVVSALAVEGRTVLMGGIFSLVGEWQHRAGLAAIDLTTGAVKPWNPNPNGGVCTAVAVSGGRVFVSGDFNTIGGAPEPRSYLAALDTLNGEVLPWNPGANQLANTLLLCGDTLYAGGEFTQVGGQPRGYLAAMNATTGEVASWAPNASWPVLAMAGSGNTIYLGGLFGQIDGQWRRGIGAVDAGTGVLTPWNPDTDYGVIKALLVAGNTVYVGGAFGQIGGAARRSIAALDASTGRATAWYPQPTAWGSQTDVKALALLDSTLLVGGDFGGIGGQSRVCLAAVDTLTGLATDWDPGGNGLVWSLAIDASSIFVGGGFTRMGGFPSTGLAAFAIPRSSRPAPSPFVLMESVPNPARGEATIRYALPEDLQVDLAVYDLQGRMIASVISGAWQAAGPHQISLSTAGWKPGFYLCRLRAGVMSATRKIVVVR